MFIKIFLLNLSLIFGQHLDEASFTINGLKALNKVSERFLSFTIDPGVVLTGLNLSESSIKMAKQLSPAFVRIAGPSTEFLRYQDDNWDETQNGDFLAVTPTMWFGINQWLNSVNLTPIFGINMQQPDVMSLLDLSDKFNVSCYWQLGFDCLNKTSKEYETDLKRFQTVLLDSFPSRLNQWKIVGSLCSDSRKVAHLDSNPIAYILEHNLEFGFKPKVPLWETSQKKSRYSTFSSVISWTKEMGQAAKNGFEVILREPKLYEIYSETPTFWVSYFHKKLMGTVVLEVKSIVPPKDLKVFSHCSSQQNQFTKSGAITIMALNDGTSNRTIFLRIGTKFSKSTEVRSYVLTSDHEDSTNIYLNGKKLRLSCLKNDKLSIDPKIRRAKLLNNLKLELPAKSVGFFVLPGVQLPICISDEIDEHYVMKEIQEDQNIAFSELAPIIKPRFHLKNLQNRLEKELASDERYFKRKEHRQLTHSSKTKDQKIFELELSSAEIRRVLVDRAKVKAAKKNIIFTNKELEDLVKKASRKILNNKKAALRIRKKIKRETVRDKKDINMRLLKLKSKAANRRKNLRALLKKPQVKASRQTRDINLAMLDTKSRWKLKARKMKSSAEIFSELDKEIATEPTNNLFKLKNLFGPAKLQSHNFDDDLDCGFDFSEEKNSSIDNAPPLVGNIHKRKCLEDSYFDDEYEEFDRLERDTFKLPLKKYRPLSEAVKIWKPMNVLGLKKPKRSITHYVNSMENSIDQDPGSYQLVFPTADKIEIIEDNQSVALKVSLNDGNKTNIQKVPKSHSKWHFIKNLTKFLQNLTDKLKMYFLNVIY